MQTMEEKDSISEKSSKGGDLILSEEAYSGYLSMKCCDHKKHSYHKTWCSLKNKLLSVYKKQEGKPLEDINIEVCTIKPNKKDGSFCFQIINGWNEYIFSTKNENEYAIWMQKLQLIASNNNNDTTNFIDKKHCILKEFSRDECNSSFEKSDSVDKFDSKSNNNGVDEVDDTYSSVNDEKIKTDDSKSNNNGFDEVDDTYSSMNDDKIKTDDKNPSSNSFLDDIYFDGNNKEDTHKPRPMRDIEIESQTSISSENDFDYESDFSDENCKGYLWIKTICDNEKAYIKLWCNLENKILSLYEEKDGKHLQDINIEITTIILVKKRRSNNFYFRIINDKTEYTFGTRTGKEYEEWINKLQFATHNINS